MSDQEQLNLDPEIGSLPKDIWYYSWREVVLARIQAADACIYLKPSEIKSIDDLIKKIENLLKKNKYIRCEKLFYAEFFIDLCPECLDECSVLYRVQILTADICMSIQPHDIISTADLKERLEKALMKAKNYKFLKR